MSAQWECQRVLYEQLKADSTFMALISNKLYDEPLTNLSYPYVVIKDAIENPDNNLCHNGYDTDIIFKIYTKPGGLGFYTAKTILTAMNNVLNMKKFTMTGFIMLICKYDNSSTRGGSSKSRKDIRSITVRYNVLSYSNTEISF